MTFEEIVTRFGGDPRSNKVKVKCPCHADTKASLSIDRASDPNKTAVLHCFAGCDYRDVLKAVGLTIDDLKADPAGQTWTPSAPDWKGYIANQLAKENLTLGDYYEYHLIDDDSYFCTRLRCVDRDGHKTMKYGILGDDGRFRFGLKGLKRKDYPALYPSTDPIRTAIDTGETIYYAEGEKDVKNLHARGYLAVTAGSTSDWLPDFVPLFRGANVVVLADNDPPDPDHPRHMTGLKFAEMVRKSLLPVAKSVKMVIPTPDIEKGDVSDYLENHTNIEFEKYVADYVEPIQVQQQDNYDPTTGRTYAHAEDKEFFESGDYAYYHIFGKNGNPVQVYDAGVAKTITSNEKYFILCDADGDLRGIPFVYRDGAYTAKRAEAYLKESIEKLIAPTFRTAPTRDRIYKLLAESSSKLRTYNEINLYDHRLINFKNGYYNPVTKEFTAHDPDDYCINQIPHTYDPNATPTGDTVEAWLNEYVCPDPDDREMLLEFCGYCLTADRSLQQFLLLVGQGGTGKSTLINFVMKMIGDDNVSGIGIDKFSERFQSYGILGKLLNACPDNRITALDDVKTLKQITGDDPVTVEKKGKMGFDISPYCKLLFSLNELPTIVGERSDAFFRRPLILTMNKKPDQVDVRLKEKLYEEMDYFIHLCVDALGRLYTAGGKIPASANSLASLKEMWVNSDVVEAWLQSDYVTRDEKGQTRCSDLYSNFFAFCKFDHRHELTRPKFYGALKTKQFTKVTVHGFECMNGIRITGTPPDANDFMDYYPNTEIEGFDD